MLRLTRLADIGVVLLTHFARQPEGAFLTARQLAESTGHSSGIVSKILKILTREGLLESHRGSKGGYALARDPDSITVADMVAALDGPIALTACTDGSCDQEGLCPVRGNWQIINRAIHDALSGVTLLDMSQPFLAGVASGRTRERS